MKNKKLIDRIEKQLLKDILDASTENAGFPPGASSQQTRAQAVGSYLQFKQAQTEGKVAKEAVKKIREGTTKL